MCPDTFQLRVWKIQYLLCSEGVCVCVFVCVCVRMRVRVCVCWMLLSNQIFDLKITQSGLGGGDNGCGI